MSLLLERILSDSCTASHSIYVESLEWEKVAHCIRVVVLSSIFIFHLSMTTMHVVLSTDIA